MSRLADVAVLGKLFRGPLVCCVLSLSHFLLARDLLEVFICLFVYIVFFSLFPFLKSLRIEKSF